MKEKIRKEKDLSKAEKKRLDSFDKVCKELKEKGYEKHNILISIFKANTVGLLTPLPFAIIYVVIYILLGKHLIYDDFSNNLLLLLFLECIITAIHEYIHGITHAIFAKNHFKDISFGFVWKQLTPYCTCDSYEKKYQYILACSMPFIVLGLLFGIVTFFFDSTFLFVMTLCNMFIASGDLLVVLLVLKNKSKKKDVLYYDHPTDVGTVMFDK